MPSAVQHIQAGYPGVDLLTCVIFQHVRHVLGVDKGIVDGHDLDIWVLHCCAQGESADASEP